ncbi:hypothetical protein [Bacillus infantis]|uniref:hypothetical protein n=1 Tax=Bacillus infantis TaxID=324767 RepID=UPI003CF34304
MNVEGLLNKVGLVLIGIGLLGGFFGLISLEYDPLFIEVPVLISQLVTVLGAALGAVIGGLVLMGLAKMIEIQQSIYNNLTSDKKYYSKVE